MPVVEIQQTIETSGTVMAEDLPQQILEQSRSMLERARLGDWKAVIQLAAERDQLVYRFFSEAPEARDSCRVAEILNEVFRLNRRVEALTRKGRERLQDGLQKIQEGRRALRAYGER